MQEEKKGFYKMKKKLFGSKFKAVLSVLVCLIFAIAFWFMVKYSQHEATSEALSVIRGLGLN